MRSGILLAFLLLCPLAWAQNRADLAPPVLGRLFDPATQSVRSILGIPGASLIGDPVDAGVPFTKIAVPPATDWLLALTAESGEVKLLQWSDGRLSLRAIERAMVAPDLMILSPTGASALLYRRDSGTLQVLSGLPASPAVMRETVTREIGLTVPGDAPPSLAVSDDGQIVLAGLAEETALRIFAAGETLKIIPLENPVSALAFAPGRNTAVMVAGPQAWLLKNLPAAPELRPFPPAAGVAGPAVAAALLADETRAVVAYRDGSIRMMDWTTGLAQRFSCDCIPGALQPLDGGAVFRLNELPQAPILLFDSSALRPRVWFVPLDGEAK